MLTNLTHEDILKLQTVGKDAQEERKQFILHDDEKASFEHLSSLKEARVDFVLDNGKVPALSLHLDDLLAIAGFELFTDLVFADFLVTYTPYVSRVVFQYDTSHPLLSTIDLYLAALNASLGLYRMSRHTTSQSFLPRSRSQTSS